MLLAYDEALDGGVPRGLERNHRPDDVLLGGLDRSRQPDIEMSNPGEVVQRRLGPRRPPARIAIQHVALDESRARRLGTESGGGRTPSPRARPRSAHPPRGFR